MIRTKIIQNAADFDAVCGLWQQLAGDSTIFQSFCWNKLAACSFVRREQPYVIGCESDSGAALIPAAIRQDGCVSLLGERLFDYRDILHAGDETVLAHAWQQLCALGRPFKLTALRGERSGWHWRRAAPRPFAHAPGVRSRDLAQLWNSAGRQRSAPSSESDGRAGYAVHPSDKDSFATLNAAILPPEACRYRFLKMHARLGRHTRRIAKQAVMFKCRSGREHELVRFIYEAKGKQATPASNLFDDPLRREFMIRIAAEQDSRCDVFTYETGSEMVAAIITFRDDAVRYCYTTYYDSRWADFSPGQLLLFKVAARSLAEGLDCDFMTGEYPYKNRIATTRVPLFTVEVAREALAQVFPAAEPQHASVALPAADQRPGNASGRPAA